MAMSFDDDAKRGGLGLNIYELNRIEELSLSAPGCICRVLQISRLVYSLGVRQCSGQGSEVGENLDEINKFITVKRQSQSKRCC